MVEIKGIGQHTVKEKTSFHHLLDLLGNVLTFLNSENYRMADTNLQIIDDSFPEENKTEEYKTELNKLQQVWKKKESELIEEIIHPVDYLRMIDAKTELEIEYMDYVRKKYVITNNLFSKNKFFENEPREYDL